jgi:alkylation response protein AidB-like acyl-CoA dehydrogenase
MAMELQGARTGYTDAQLELMDSLQPLLEKHCSPALIRRLLEDDGATAEAIWAPLAEGGWTSLLYPEDVGGQGLGVSEMAGVLVAAGRRLLPGPFFASAVLTPLALAASGQSVADLPGVEDVAAGRRIASLALFEEAALFPEPKIAARVDGGRISGVKRFVQDAQQADFLLVLAKDATGDLVLAWVPAKAAGVEVLVHPTLDGRRLCTVTLDQAVVARTLPLAGEGRLQGLMLRISALVSCLQVGGAEAALGLAVEYAQTRVQFDRPIGAFQAISHRLVDLYCNLTVGRGLVQKAIRLADDDSFPDAASRAKLWMNDSYRTVTKGALQTFGGIGFTFDHDIHLYLRAAHVLASEFGGSADHQRLLRPAARAA